MNCLKSGLVIIGEIICASSIPFQVVCLLVLAENFENARDTLHETPTCRHEIY